MVIQIPSLPPSTIGHILTCQYRRLPIAVFVLISIIQRYVVEGYSGSRLASPQWSASLVFSILSCSVDKLPTTNSGTPHPPLTLTNLTLNSIFVITFCTSICAVMPADCYWLLFFTELHCKSTNEIVLDHLPPSRNRRCIWLIFGTNTNYSD